MGIPQVFPLNSAISFQENEELGALEQSDVKWLAKFAIHLLQCRWEVCLA